MNKRIIFLFLSLTMIFSLMACGSSKDNSNQLTGFNGILEDNFCFAVDIDDFDGHVFKSGNYHIDFDVKEGTDIPYYELFISDNYYDDFDYVRNAPYPEVDGPYYLCSPVFLDGGTPQDIQLDSGKYVYIIVYTENGSKNETTLHLNLSE